MLRERSRACRHRGEVRPRLRSGHSLIQVAPTASGCGSTRRPRDDTAAAAATPFILEISGRTCTRRSVSSSSSKARRAWPSVSILVSSSRMRSRLTAWMRAASLRMAASVDGSISNPKRAAKRTARRRRSWSSSKRFSGWPMARMMPASRSSRPPT